MANWHLNAQAAGKSTRDGPECGPPMIWFQ
jgi:hypothetical protein